MISSVLDANVSKCVVNHTSDGDYPLPCLQSWPIWCQQDHSGSRKHVAYANVIGLRLFRHVSRGPMIGDSGFDQHCCAFFKCFELICVSTGTW